MSHVVRGVINEYGTVDSKKIRGGHLAAFPPRIWSDYFTK
jgi:hypothetical protein